LFAYWYAAQEGEPGVTTKKNVYDSVKTAAEEITAQRLEMFLKELDVQIQTLRPLKGKNISATTIDNFLRRASSQARLEIGSLNRVAFEFWKMLEDEGTNITQREFCQIVPDPEIENRIARAVEKHYAKGKSK
jgi:hypothetical protein